MPSIYVCSLARLPETVERTGARRIATLISGGTVVERPAAIGEADHLFIGMDDISAPIEGYVTPGEEHVARFLDFVRGWDRKHPLIIHCWAGVSRSTAGAFAAYAALRPDIEEETIARRIRERSPEASPNPLVVSHADRLLGRDGRMVRAAAGIGRGAECFEGSVFALHLDE